jgi:hypothetical protein
VTLCSCCHSLLHPAVDEIVQQTAAQQLLDDGVVASSSCMRCGMVMGRVIIAIMGKEV